MQPRFTPYLLDRLLDDTPDGPARPVLSLEGLKRTVALDLEALLNTRRGLTAEEVQPYAQVRRSVAAFGLDDFAARSMASTDDQAFVCRSIERAIADHEPRLRSVQVVLQPREGSGQSLKFAIRAVLQVHPMAAPVNFDAVLQTATQQYAVAPARRVGAEGGAA